MHHRADAPAGDQTSLAGRIPRPSGAGDAVGDPHCDLEVVVDRLARLVLNANALAERMDRLPDPDGAETGRPERIGRLHAAVELGRRAIEAAVRLAEAGGEVTWPGQERRLVDRRRREGDRRVPAT